MITFGNKYLWLTIFLLANNNLISYLLYKILYRNCIMGVNSSSKASEQKKANQASQVRASQVSTSQNNKASKQSGPATVTIIGSHFKQDP